MFYQFLCVQHSRSSTQSWGSVLPSIVETRDQNFQGRLILKGYKELMGAGGIRCLEAVIIHCMEFYTRPCVKIDNGNIQINNMIHFLLVLE